VALKSATEPIDTSNPSGRLIFQMLASFAEYERETIGERTRAGLHRAFRNGKHAGRIPYGYRVRGEDGLLEVVEDEAAIVREIIANVAAGSTLYGESKRLNDEGVPSPGWRFKSGERKHGASWSGSTVAGIVHQSAYSGTHRVKANGGEESISREVPAVVDAGLQQRAIEALAENKRYPNRENDRRYLLRGLVSCETCGYACTGRTSSARGKRYSYYCCVTSRSERGVGGSRVPPHRPPNMSAPWLEDLVWRDVRTFLENPGETLERVREQLAGDDRATEELEARLADLTKRLAAKQSEKDRYVRLYAQGHISEEELETYLLDLKHQIDNLRLLIESAQADLSRSAEKELAAKNTEAWLLTLRNRIVEVEEDTDEAFEKRRELAKLLVERIDVGRDENGRPRARITYRFGPPRPPTGAQDARAEEDTFVTGEPNSSTILAQNAGTSSGLRLVTSAWSTTTSSSTQWPAALRMSVRRVGYEVRVRPFTTSASTSVHGPWQITPTGLAWSKKECTKLTASSLPRSLSAPTVPPGTIRPSYSSAKTSEKVFSTVNVSPGLTSLFMVWASPVWRPTTSTVAPSLSTAFFDSSNSTCSVPTGARRMAIFLPCNSLATGVLLSID
jgi:site-specific DNA recombinase